MIILGIETSCDETGVAIVQDGVRVLSSAVASSLEIHKKYGGIMPEQAAREQVKCLIPVLEETVKKAKIKLSQIDAVAVTTEPGLIGSLLIGVEAAKTLSFSLQKPLIPVNHLLAHLYACLFNSQLENREIGKLFPAVCLVVSGGHTELFLARNHQNFKWLGGTRDDAAGECFDKSARILGLGYPGGPVIEKASEKFIKKNLQLDNSQFAIKLPRPMISQNNFDFSFSGLKTAVLNQVKEKKFSKEFFAYELQEAITDCLVKKTQKAVNKFLPKSILVAGGVAANKRLREKFKKTFKNGLFLAPYNLCTDNATMVASRAFFNMDIVDWRKIQVIPN